MDSKSLLSEQGVNRTSSRNQKIQNKSKPHSKTETQR